MHDQLENMRKWIANDEVSMALADAHVDAGLQPEAKAVVPELLDALVLSPEGFALGENTSDFQDREAILKVLEEHAFSEKKQARDFARFGISRSLVSIAST